jgi:hypothetical protein
MQSQKQYAAANRNAGDLTRLSVDVFLSNGPVRKIVFEAEIHPRRLLVCNLKSKICSLGVPGCKWYRLDMNSRTEYFAGRWRMWK